MCFGVFVVYFVYLYVLSVVQSWGHSHSDSYSIFAVVCFGHGLVTD